MNPNDVKELIAFVEATPSPVPHHGPLWWAGPFPADPEHYRAEDWERANPPVVQLFRDYVFDLGRECDATASDALIKHWIAACQILAEVER